MFCLPCEQSGFVYVCSFFCWVFLRMKVVIERFGSDVRTSFDGLCWTSSKVVLALGV